MGIRVFCPNGHRLNLKSHLAGKQGVCPHCGMTVNIPSLEKAEELGMLKNPREVGRAGLAADSVGTLTGSRGGAAVLTMDTTQPRSGATADVPCEPSLASPYAPSTAKTTHGTNGSAANGSGTNGAGVAPQESRASARLDDGGIEIPLRGDVPAAAAPVENEVDPIAENPQAVWYVRTPQGGQYGPAAGDIMRKWIAEGRVQADFWVWREGWGDWQKASASLPSLRQAPAASAPATVATSGPSAGASSTLSAVAAPARQTSVPAPARSGEPNGYATGDEAATPRVARSRRRGIHPLAILAVVGLGLICLALFGVLVAMLAGAI